EIIELTKYYPAVVLVGPRQVGKTSLTKAIRNQIGKPSVYLDLERPRDLAKLADLEALIAAYPEHVLIFDEIQREPSLFPQLRAIIDQNRQAGRFILLGSASPALIRDSSESLAGRVAYLELSVLQWREVKATYDFRQHWFRGGFPLSLLAPTDAVSSRWRDDFIRAYLERELPMLGLTASPTVLRRMWTMLAHVNGQLLNKTQLANSLDISVPSLSKYLDFLEQAYLIRRLPPYFANLGKRLVKSPKLYLRDTGILHELLAIQTPGELLGHPAIGASWENYVLEQLAAIKPRWAELHFYRTQGGSELDVVITKGGIPYSCAEVKHSVNPTLSKGFYQAITDLKLKKNYLIAPVEQPYSLKSVVTVMGVQHLAKVFE
ncbi:MAG: ATP-binding protein, partial [Bacteroidota bacterium]